MSLSWLRPPRRETNELSVDQSDGTPVAGLEVRWIGRRHGRRKDRRWARSWSPEQIAIRLPLDFPNDGSMRISHEAIYRVTRGASRVWRVFTPARSQF